MAKKKAVEANSEIETSNEVEKIEVPENQAEPASAEKPHWQSDYEKHPKFSKFQRGEK